ncbi:hypothetical protein [Streptomyces sp. WAC00263]|uniref:hypothetical protein n=1 Tax=Streptomyces sp. WAC00263 TaxID=1917422 RepID=UPI0015EF235F|nr:hypothetical protein [Streptomyces sp. WAC00263]
MRTLALALVAVQLLTVAACAVRLARHPRDPARLPRTLHRTAAVLLGASALPLVALLATEASMVAWGLWGAGYLTAAVVWAGADTLRDIPAARTAPGAPGAR